MPPAASLLIILTRLTKDTHGGTNDRHRERCRSDVLDVSWTLIRGPQRPPPPRGSLRQCRRSSAPPPGFGGRHIHNVHRRVRCEKQRRRSNGLGGGGRTRSRKRLERGILAKFWKVWDPTGVLASSAWPRIWCCTASCRGAKLLGPCLHVCAPLTTDHRALLSPTFHSSSTQSRPFFALTDGTSLLDREADPRGMSPDVTK